jgi:hypothetical protein
LCELESESRAGPRGRELLPTASLCAVSLSPETNPGLQRVCRLNRVRRRPSRAEGMATSEIAQAQVAADDLATQPAIRSILGLMIRLPALRSRPLDRPTPRSLSKRIVLMQGRSADEWERAGND